MAAAHITSDTFQQTLDEAGDKPVFVDFYAEWCGPCKISGPIIDKLSDEYADSAVLVKINVDENNDKAGEHGVMAIPTVVIFKNGEEVAREVGFPGEEKYRKLIDEAIAG
jgi:thioredoxin 1